MAFFKVLYFKNTTSFETPLKLRVRFTFETDVRKYKRDIVNDSIFKQTP